MTNYTNYERETTIVMNDDENKATVCTFQRVMQRSLRKLIKEYPDDCELIKEYSEDDGLIVTVPKKWIKVKPPKKMNLTEEQIAERTVRMRKLLENK